MDTAAAVILTLAAFGGLVLASFPLRGIPRPPTWLALGHGAIAAAGLGTLIYFALTTAVTTMTLVATAILGAAALGGFVLFAGFHLRERPLPIVLVLGHGLTALTGVVLLWLAILQIV
jgi:hypothetical protein